MTEHQPTSGNPESGLTELINRAARGNVAAQHAILPAVYEELRRLAAAKRRGAAAGETLRTTVLVHEAYIRIFENEPEGWSARSHFFFTAARAMRDILVEDARRRAAEKHGGGLERVSLDDCGISLDAPPDQVLSLHRCLERLERDDEVGHKVVLLRFFVGMSMPEVADVMQTPLRTVERKWSFVRAWLASELAAP